MNYSLSDPFSQRFMVSFAEECTSRGIRLYSAAMRHESADAKNIPVGLDEIKAVIKEFGSQYSGTLLLTSFPEQHRLQDWVESLAVFKKPVVFFDSTDKGGGISAKRYYRAHLDDRGALNSHSRRCSAKITGSSACTDSKHNLLLLLILILIVLAPKPAHFSFRQGACTSQGHGSINWIADIMQSR